MEEKLLRCRDCGESFIFSTDEQLIFSENEWDAPCRCHDCRQAKKERSRDPYAGWQSTMGSYRGAKRGHRRVQYSGPIFAGGLSH